MKESKSKKVVVDVTLVLDDVKLLEAHKTTRTKIINRRMAVKIALEEQVKALQKNMGGIAKLVKDLKHTVEGLEKRLIVKELEELKEILDAQKVIDEVIVANSDAIKRIDREIMELTKHKMTKVPKDTLENVAGDAIVEKVKRKCRYHNRGFCKRKGDCRFVHSEQICKDHMRNKECEIKDCPDRHPKMCKWLKSKVGCKREGCEYLHVTLANEEGNSAEYKCASCKDIWTDGTCVVEYTSQNQLVYFCLNCDEWVQNKENVFDAGWTLLDKDGYLRMGI